MNAAHKLTIGLQAAGVSVSDRETDADKRAARPNADVHTIGVLAVVPDAWEHVVMPRHQILKRLAHHFAVVWVEPAAGWREYWIPGRSRFLEKDCWSTPAVGLDVFTPGRWHPLFLRPRWLSAWTQRSRLATARQRLIDRGATRIVLYVWRDVYADALDLVAHDGSCYHIDDEYSFQERDVPNSPRELGLLQRVDRVIVHSSALFAKKGSANPHTIRVPNGVDYESYSSPKPVPADLAAIPRPRIGYAGVIKKQLDFALLVRIARARPDHSFVLVGPIMYIAGKEAALEELRGLANVHFLGNKDPEELPAYVQHFDVCLMCYDVNDYTKYIYPLKLNEYLATGRPVISSSIHSVIGLENVVAIARTDEEWLAAIDRALAPATGAPQLVDERRAFARAHDWDVLVDRIAEQLRAAVDARVPGVGRAPPG